MSLMRKICGVSISHLHKMRTSILKSMALVNMGNGISASIQKKMKRTKRDINFPMAILKRFTAAACLLPKAELDNMNMLTLNVQQRIFMG